MAERQIARDVMPPEFFDMDDVEFRQVLALARALARADGANPITPDENGPYLQRACALVLARRPPGLLDAQPNTRAGGGALGAGR